MIAVEHGFYRIPENMSSRKFRKTESPTGAPRVRNPVFVKNLRKLVDLHYEGNMSNLANELGVDPRRISDWSHGTLPNRAAIKLICRVIGCSEHELLHSELKTVREYPDSWGGPPAVLTKQQRKQSKLIDRFAAIVDKAAASPQILAKLEQQIQFIELAFSNPIPEKTPHGDGPSEEGQ